MAHCRWLRSPLSYFVNDLDFDVGAPRSANTLEILAGSEIRTARDHTAAY
jgi:hypothetical protein